MKKQDDIAEVRGVQIKNIIMREPGNGLPKSLKKEAAIRGYGDAAGESRLSLYITEDDINAACDAAAHGDGSNCVMAQAGRRLGVKCIYFYRTTAWVDLGTGPIVRFKTSKAIYKNVIDPFDRGVQEEIIPGVYHLTPACESQSLKRGREYRKTGAKRSCTRREWISHTERVVNASRA